MDRNSSRISAALAAALLAAGAAPASPARRAAPAARSSSFVALSPDGRWWAASNPDSGSVTLLDAATAAPVREIRVGARPQTVAFTEDSRALLTANRGSGDVSWIDVDRRAEAGRIAVGAEPFGVVVADGKAYVSAFADDSLVVIDLASRAVERRVAVGPSPAGLAAAPGRLLVTHFFSGELSVLDRPSLSVRRVISFGKDANLSASVAVSPDLKTAYLPQSRSRSAELARAPDTTVQPVIERVDLETLRSAGRFGFDRNDLPAVNRPVAVLPSADGALLYCVNAGTDDVAVLEARRGRELAHLRVGANPQGAAWSADGRRLLVDATLDGRLDVLDVAGLEESAFLARMPQHPRLPREAAAAGGPGRLNDGTRLVSCAACHPMPSDAFRRDRVAGIRPDGAVDAVVFPGPDDVADRALRFAAPAELSERAGPVRSSRVELTRIPLDPATLRGKRLFNAAGPDRLSMGGWVSCASCHPDGGTDRRTWAGFPDGPRNTPALHSLAETLPLHWSGDLDELQDVEATVRRIQFGHGLADGPLPDTLGPALAGRSKDLDDLAAYLRTLRPPRPPRRAAAASIEAGRAAFSRAGCAACHPPPFYTDRALHDVGTGDRVRERNAHGRGTAFDTPSLLGVWASAPYLHDGSATSLEEVLRVGGPHRAAQRLSAAERAALLDFLNALPEDAAGGVY